MRRLRVIPTLAATAIAAMVVPAFGETALPVHGGIAALACAAGLPAHLATTRVLPELARRNGALPDRSPETVQAPRYFTWLEELESRLRRAGTPGALAPADTRARNRKAVERVLEWLGFDSSGRNAAFEIEARRDDNGLERLMFSKCLGIERSSLAAALKAEAAVPIVPPTDTVPSPLSIEVWKWLLEIDERPGETVIRRLVEDRRGLIFFFALTGFDGHTLTWLVAQPDLMRRIYRDHSGTFAATGHALRIRQGRIELPGGGESAAVWEALIDARVSQPADFARALFARDSGRAADFFASIASLPPSTQQALMRSDDFRRLYDVFKAASEAWNSVDVPFNRLHSDPAFVLLTLLADGTPVTAGPPWRRAWEAGFEARSLSSDDDDLAGDIARGGAVSLSWIVSKICETPETLASRLRLARFARRMFSDMKSEQAGDVAVTLAAFDRLSGVLLELDRVGVRDPAVFARVSERALDFIEEDHDRIAPTMVAWQGTLAILSAATISGAIPGTDASPLVNELTRLQQGRDRRWEGSLARFIRDRLLPAAGVKSASIESDRPLEDGLLLALSRSKNARDEEFEWEGLRYRARVAEARAARARAIAAAQPRASLDDVLALFNAAEALAKARTVADVRAALLPLDAVEMRLPREVPWLFTTEHDPLEPAETLDRPLRDARRITRDRDVKRAERAIEALTWLGDQLLSDTLPAVFYAARLAVGLSPPAAVAGVWRRHEFGLRVLGEESAPKPDLVQGWQIPQAGALPDGGWYARGSLTGLDFAIGDLWLRRLPGGPVPSPSRLSAGNAIVLSKTVASFLIEPAVADPPAWPPDVAAPAEAWHDVASEIAPAAWGFFPPDDGCYCRESPSLVSSRAWLGRPYFGTLFQLTPDLNLRIATLARSIGLPAVLVPLLLATAYQDLLDGAMLAHPDDWTSLVGFMNALTRERFEEYVFALIATRELAAITKVP